MELLKNLEGLSADEQMSAVVELQKAAMKHLEEQKQASIGKSAEMVILGLKKIKSDFEAKFDSLNYDIQTKVANLKDGEQGLQGPKGEQGDRGLDGYQGKDGKSGIDGKDGLDGVDGVSVQDAKIDFDGSLVITLSDGKEINVGEVVPVDVAEKIRTVHNIQSGSGGDSQTVLDAIAALQATIATYGTMATQNANAVAITGGTINNTTVGATTPSTGVFTTLTAQNETLKGTGQNLLIYSNTFTNGAWTATGATVATTVVTTDPFGGSNAYLVTASVTGTAGLTSPSITATTSTYTLSLYAKAGTSPFLRIFTASNVWFNLSNGTLGTVGGGLTASITSAGNGWYRCVVSFTGTSGAFSPLFRLADADNATPATSGTTQFIYGAQLEISSVANTYIPTTTTAVYGTPTLSFSGVASIGLQSDGSLYETSAGTGNVRFYTNNIGQEQARVSHTASAVNYHQLTGSVTGSGPIHSVAGSDTNIDLNLTTKGTGAVNLNTGAGTQVRIIDSGGTAVNRIHLQGQATGFLPIIASRGSDTNLGMSYSTQGTGAHDFYTAGTSFAQQVKIAHTASAVNYVQVTGAATTGTPIISAQGSDASIPLQLRSKGTFNIGFANGSGNQGFVVSPTGSANYLQATSSNTTVAPSLAVAGSDTNIPLVLQPKGTGALQAQQTDSTATGGNARGARAVDWQTLRSNASEIASGFVANITGGYANTASGGVSGVLSGTQNNAAASISVISGGIGNTTTGSNYGNSYSFVGSGYTNTAGGVFNFIGGGYLNSGTSATAVTTQSATMNATTAVTLAASNASIKVGQIIAGTSISSFPPTYVAAVSGTSLTLSKVASGSSTSTLSFYTPHGVVVGGGNNQATGSYSFIGGGGDAGTASNRNVASGDWSVVAGGFKNTAIQAYTFIGGGNGNVVSGTYSTIAGGSANGIYASYATIGGGLVNSVTGFGASVVGGYSNSASGSYSVTGAGTFSTTRGINSMQVISGDGPVSGTAGSAQSGLLILGRQTTDATATRLASDGNAAGTTNQVILPNNSAYTFRGEVVSGVTGGGNSKSWTIEGLIKRGANAASTTLVGSTVTSMYADVGAATWVIALSADTTNGGLAVTFTGQAATTIRTVCQIRTTEMTY